VSTQLRSHANAQQDFQALKGLRNIKTILNFGMLEVRENEMSLRRWSGGAAHLPALEGTLNGSALNYMIKVL